MFHFTGHPSDETLRRAVDDECSAWRRAVLARHVAGCRPCRARLRLVRSWSNDLSRANGDHGAPALDPGMRARFRERLAALSAGLDAAQSRPGRLAAHARVATAGAVLAGIALVAVARVQRLAPSIPDSPATLVATGALPVRALTPGAADIVRADELCAGRPRTRPPVPADVRQAVLRDYGMLGVPGEEYELDYLITPELGGATDRRNLWPERYGLRTWNARVKDELEDLLPQMVCRGQLDLATAQQDIATDWIAAYKRYFHTDLPIMTQAQALSDDDRPDFGRPVRR